MSKISQWLVHLVFLIMILLIFLSIITKIKDNKLHQLRVEVREYAFLRDTVLSSSNEILYSYTPKENILLKINKEKCIIQAEFKNQQNVPVTFKCVKNDLKNLEEKFNEKEVILQKNE